VKERCENEDSKGIVASFLRATSNIKSKEMEKCGAQRKTSNDNLKD
jgi:hypothetical protein